MVARTRLGPKSVVTDQLGATGPGLYRALPWLGAVVAVVPDADVLMHAFVDYSHPFGHRGALHSLGFYAVLSGGLVVPNAFKGARWLVALTLFVSLITHSLLDMLTNGGLGISLFWPLSDQRTFFPWRPIPVSPLSVASFFSERGLRILAHELPFALPCFIAAWWWTRPASRAPRRAEDAPSAATEESSSDPASADAPDDETSRDEDDVAVLEITDHIDLHHFAPRDILSVVDAYLEAAWEKGFDEVRLIHGRGKGVQRARVQKLLSTHPLVISYKDAPQTRGGWGATIAWLAPRSEPPRAGDS
jgi:membrane-bound metal-dependent hydrolase YbcI (DUF457 family)/DNA-nicking Smr family endonuclease